MNQQSTDTESGPTASRESPSRTYHTTHDELIRDIQERYREAADSLNELQRRHWAAVEALKLGWGGISMVSRALRMSPNTIKRGIQETADKSSSGLEQSVRIRRPGGGRRKKLSADPPTQPVPNGSVVTSQGNDSSFDLHDRYPATKKPEGADMRLQSMDEMTVQTEFNNALTHPEPDHQSTQ